MVKLNSHSANREHFKVCVLPFPAPHGSDHPSGGLVTTLRVTDGCVYSYRNNIREKTLNPTGTLRGTSSGREISNNVERTLNGGSAVGSHPRNHAVSGGTTVLTGKESGVRRGSL